jgi:4-hydroxy-tetrahydrodipicolinate synthase
MWMIEADAIRGVVVPVATPLAEDESVDERALARLIAHLTEGGVHGLFLFGTTGEAARLDDEQKRAAAEAAIAANGGRLPVFFGVSDCGTRKVIRNIRWAERMGADVIVCTLPYYFPVRDPREQLAFFEAVLGSTELPVMLYNIPSTINAEIDPEVVRKLSGVSNMIGIKDSGGNAEYLRRLTELAGEGGFKVLVGDESLSLQGLRMGAHGLVPSLANVWPALLVDLYESCLRGDDKKAEYLQARLDEINRFNDCSQSWLSALIFRKKALSMLGICGEKLAEPYLKPDEETVRRMEAAIRRWQAEFADSGNPAR